jgi:hypothetical protein
MAEARARLFLAAQEIHIFQAQEQSAVAVPGILAAQSPILERQRQNRLQDQ